jgi:hypothetical protein
MGKSESPEVDLQHRRGNGEVEGEAVTKQNLIIRGTELLRAGMLASGLKAYRIAEVEPSRSILVLCAEACLRVGLIEHALKAYELADTLPPLEKLQASEHRCLREGRVDDAIAVRIASGIHHSG